MKPGSIPTETVAPKLAMLIRDRWPHGGGIDLLAEKVGCDVSTIEGVLAQDSPGVAFDLADKLFCSLGRPMEDVGLAEMYWSADFVETCSSPACNKTFAEKNNGSTIKRYCSKRCRDMAFNIAHGRGSGLTARGLCKKGHRMTPANSVLQNGRRTCRLCKQERQRKWRRETRVAA